MKTGFFLKRIVTLVSLLGLMAGCAAPPRAVTPAPPAFPEGFLHARWGSSVDAVKEAVAKDGHPWFKDSTDRPPYALYAHGKYLGTPAIFSYFFTPTTKRLCRVDVTFNDLRVLGKAKDSLVQEFRQPSFSQSDVDNWCWEDHSLIILQRDAVNVQIVYASGPFLVLNQQEEDTLK